MYIYINIYRHLVAKGFNEGFRVGDSGCKDVSVPDVVGVEA